MNIDIKDGERTHQSYCDEILLRSQPVINSNSQDGIVIFQEVALFPWLTVFENVEFGLRITNIPKYRRK
ncbi:MAG: hypothetical protein WAM14_24090 [Candidatus Nitrosopolaris sp.]